MVVDAREGLEGDIYPWVEAYWAVQRSLPVHDIRVLHYILR